MGVKDRGSVAAGDGQTRVCWQDIPAASVSHRWSKQFSLQRGFFRKQLGCPDPSYFLVLKPCRVFSVTVVGVTTTVFAVLTLLSSSGPVLESCLGPGLLEQTLSHRPARRLGFTSASSCVMPWDRPMHVQMTLYT